MVVALFIGGGALWLIGISFTVDANDLSSDAWYDELARDLSLGDSLVQWVSGAAGLILGLVALGFAAASLDAWQKPASDDEASSG